MTYERIDRYSRIYAGERCQDGARRCPFAQYHALPQEFWCARYRMGLDYEGHAEVPLRCEACLKEG